MHVYNYVCVCVGVCNYYSYSYYFRTKFPQVPTYHILLTCELYYYNYGNYYDFVHSVFFHQQQYNILYCTSTVYVFPFSAPVFSKSYEQNVKIIVDITNDSRENEGRFNICIAQTLLLSSLHMPLNILRICLYNIHEQYLIMHAWCTQARYFSKIISSWFIFKVITLNEISQFTGQTVLLLYRV